MRAHLVQLDIAWEDPGANHALVERMLAEAAVPVAPGDLVVLPEMFDTGFSLNTERTGSAAEASSPWLASLARRLQATVVAGTTAPGRGKARNRALVFGPEGGEIARYDKVHPFSFGREPERFEGGSRVVVFEWGALRVSPLVCYDLRFPELFRAGLSLGAQAFVVIANWPASRVGHWRTLLAARAIENQAIVMGVNRAGADPHLVYPGSSLAVGPRGETLVDAAERPKVVALEVDPGRVLTWRDTFPAWRDGVRSLQPRISADGSFERP